MVSAPKPEHRSRASSPLLGAGDLDAALALTTEDVVLDRSNSHGPVARRRRAATTRSARPIAEFRDPVGGVTWEPMSDSRMVGRELAADRDRGRRSEGRSSGINVARPRRLAGPLRRRPDRRGRSCTRASRTRCSRPGGRLLAAARLYFVCEALPRRARPGAAARGRDRRRRRRDPAAREGAPLRRGADRLRRAVRARGPRARGALLPQRRARTWSRPAAPTASTSARTTSRSRRPAPAAGARGAGRALDPLARRSSTPRSRPPARRAPGPDQRRAGLGDADQGGPAGGRARADRARGAGRRRGRRGSRSAASTRERRRGGRRRRAADRRRARDPRRRRPRGRGAASCARRSSAEPGASLRADGEPGAKAGRAAQAQGARRRAAQPSRPAKREAMAARTEAKNEAARDELEPLAEGERPRW